LSIAPLPSVTGNSNNASVIELPSTPEIRREAPMHPSSAVTAIPPAPSDLALAHFEALLRFETDCADVHDALVVKGRADFVLLDVRSPALYAAGHVPRAVNLPHAKIIASKLAQYAPDTLFVTYCAGPHCNGATRGAIRLARLGRPVKVMAGGIMGWLDEGFALAKSTAPDRELTLPNDPRAHA
jgi:rhodanese-related sulfurtransferase